ncbi:TPA: hypothetical protein U3P08_001940 [Streptococcus agalactiae]|nr:hypothetical protein [Streptococcus agalactiae]
MISTTLTKMYTDYPATASIIPYKDWVIVAYPSYKGVGVDVYESPYSLDEFDNFERRFDRIYHEEGIFEDIGFAVKWAFEKLGE